MRRYRLLVTTTGHWRPLSARRAGDERWHEKLPAALADQLREWISDAGEECTSQQLDRILLRLHLRFQEPRIHHDDDDNYPVISRKKQVLWFLSRDVPEKRLLDIVDALLDFLPQRPAPSAPTAPLTVRILAGLELVKADHRRLLHQHLTDARLAYRIAANGLGLVQRTDPATTLAIQDAVTAADNAPSTGSASDFLQSGWAALHGLHPDAPQAYSFAIKAVEASAHAVVQPRRAKATLGTMLGELRATSHLFTVKIGPDGTADSAVLIAMIDLLWAGQTSRHGGQHPTRLETGDEARAALHLATTLMAWFTRGAVVRRTG
jgi:hypothetical protein